VPVTLPGAHDREVRRQRPLEQLLEMISRSVVPRSTWASMRTVGMPQIPKPPEAMTAPWGMSATASAAVVATLSRTFRLIGSFAVSRALPGRGHTDRSRAEPSG
jgi:hypothetical protein